MQKSVLCLLYLRTQPGSQRSLLSPGLLPTTAIQEIFTSSKGLGSQSARANKSSFEAEDGEEAMHRLAGKSQASLLEEL